MGDVGELSLDDKIFLEPHLPLRRDTSSAEPRSEGPWPTLEKEDLPFVTLTYASSLDSMIALGKGARTTLSGPESKRMTHYLRLRHDAILIGAGTAIVDDPSLNCRYPGAALDDQPRPVIVDPNKRWNYHSKKVFALALNGAGRAPWIVSHNDTLPEQRLLDVGGDHLVVESGDFSVAETGSDQLGDTWSVPWRGILRELKRRGINSVMIEGGARVINTLLCMPNLIDSVIITIAPTWLGQGGVEVQPMGKTENGQRVNSVWLQKAIWRQFGNDVVVCGSLSDKKP